MRAHYADVAERRTIIVDHLEYVPTKQPGLGIDELGRQIATVNQAMVFAITFCRDDGVDERYLERCFSRSEIERIIRGIDDIIRVMGREGHGLTLSSGNSPVAVALNGAGSRIIR